MLESLVTERLGPASIFFWPYLLCAGLVAAGWLIVIERYPTRAAVGILSARTLWRCPSTRLDLLFSVGFVLALQLPVRQLEQAAFVETYGALDHWLASLAPVAWGLRAPPVLEGILATLITMLAIDASSYGVHRGLHCCAPFWRLHAVHHAATGLTPLTTYRQHPLEPLLLNSARGLAAALGLALFHWVFVQHTPVVTWYGLGAGFFLYMFTVNLHHAPVPVRYPPWLRRVLMSPHLHHLHHSAESAHQQRNFGVVFSIWDRLFGTYLERDFKTGELRFGLGEGDPFAHSWRASLLQPLLAPRDYQPPPLPADWPALEDSPLAAPLQLPP